MKHPVTPDGRYFIVRGRLWRIANSDLGEAERSDPVNRLMAARRAVRTVIQQDDPNSEATARTAVDKVKHALGERGPVW